MADSVALLRDHRDLDDEHYIVTNDTPDTILIQTFCR